MKTRNGAAIGRGITLMEVLVTITLCGMLASLLVPAVSKAQSVGQAIACAGNQRSIYQGSALYANNDKERRFPPLILPQSVVSVTRFTQSGNFVDRFPTDASVTAVVGTNTAGAFNPQANFAEVLAYYKFTDPKVLWEKSDTNSVPSWAAAAAAASPGVAVQPLSYGLNLYLYTFKVDGWGGSCYPSTPTAENVGGKGDKGYGFYGPKFDTHVRDGIISPSDTIFLGDRISGDGPGIGFGWARATQLDLSRHLSQISLTFCDGSSRMGSYDRFWGRWSRGGYQLGRSIDTAANIDFWYASRRSAAPYSGMAGATAGVASDLGQRGTWPGPNYSAVNPLYGGTPGFYVHSTVMPYWQGWERQPFAPGLP